MLLDNENQFSDNQKITAAAISTDVVKMASTEHGMTEVAFGDPIPLLIQVVEDFAGATALKVEVQTSATEDFASPVTLVTAEETDATKLKAGYKFPIISVPKGNKGYMRLKYTPTGTVTAGAITAGVVAGYDNSYHDM